MTKPRGKPASSSCVRETYTFKDTTCRLFFSVHISRSTQEKCLLSWAHKEFGYRGYTAEECTNGSACTVSSLLLLLQGLSLLWPLNLEWLKKQVRLTEWAVPQMSVLLMPCWICSGEVFSFSFHIPFAEVQTNTNKVVIWYNKMLSDTVWRKKGRITCISTN